jgi:hypothetical protein
MSRILPVDHCRYARTVRLVCALSALAVLCFTVVLPGSAQYNMGGVGLNYPLERFAAIDHFVAISQGQFLYISENDGIEWRYSGFPSTIHRMLPLISAEAETLIFVGCDSGLFVSSDHLTTRSLVDSSFASMRVWDLCVAAGAGGSQTLFAGGLGVGVLRSTDDGKHWITVNNGLTSLNITHLFANCAALFAVDTAQGLFRSLDAGSSWTNIQPGMKGCLCAQDSTLFMGTASGVYRSSNNGVAWSRTGLADTSVNTLLIMNRPSRGQAIVAVTDSGVFLSTNSGAAWGTANGGPGKALAGGKILGFGIHDSTMFAGLLYGRDQTIYHWGTYKSTDFGASWAESGTDVREAQERGLFKVGDDLYALEWGRLLKRIGTHHSWASVFQTAYPNELAAVSIGPESGGSVMHFMAIVNRMGDIDQKCAFRSSDGGRTWSEIGFPRVNGERNVVPLGEKDSILFFVVSKTPTLPVQDSIGGLFMSSDVGRTWNRSTNVTLNTLLTIFLYPGVVTFPDPSAKGGRSLVIGSGWAFRSTNNGATWSQDSAGVVHEGSYTPVPWKNTLYLRVSGSVHYEVHYEDGFPFSVPVFTPSGLYRWNPANNTWNQVGGDLPVSAQSGLVIAASASDPDRPVMFICGNDPSAAYAKSAFISRDEGIHWIRVPNILSTVDQSVTILRDTIYGVYNGSIWYQALPTGSTEVAQVNPDVPKELSLYQNYPNPFNPTTKIGFRVPGLGSRVKLAVYDLLGREVAVLIDERKEEGRYEVEWNAGGLSSGVYIYRMTAGGITQSREMLLLR